MEVLEGGDRRAARRAGGGPGTRRRRRAGGRGRANTSSRRVDVGRATSANAATGSAITGRVAPACGTMISRFGWRAIVPLSTRFTTARVVSNRNSSIGRGRPNEVCSQQAGDVGWMKHAGLPTVELVEHRLERGVAEVGAAERW